MHDQATAIEQRNKEIIRRAIADPSTIDAHKTAKETRQREIVRLAELVKTLRREKKKSPRRAARPSHLDAIEDRYTSLSGTEKVVFLEWLFENEPCLIRIKAELLKKEKGRPRENKARAAGIVAMRLPDIGKPASFGQIGKKYGISATHARTISELLTYHQKRVDLLGFTPKSAPQWVSGYFLYSQKTQSADNSAPGFRHCSPLIP